MDCYRAEVSLVVRLRSIITMTASISRENEQCAFANEMELACGESLVFLAHWERDNVFGFHVGALKKRESYVICDKTGVAGGFR